MTTLTADVTNNINKMAEILVRKGIYKSKSEVVRDAIRQLAYKYGIAISSLQEVRKITKKAVKKSGKTLSESVIKLREEV